MFPLNRYILIALIAAASALSALAQGNPGTILGAGYVSPAAINIAPGQIITVYAAGVGSSLTQAVYAAAGKWPTSLAGIGVTIVQGGTNYPAPIQEVSPVETCGTGCAAITAITIQVPYGLWTGCALSNTACPALAMLTEFFVTDNGVAGPFSSLNPEADQVHFLTACDPVITGGPGSLAFGGLPCQPIVTHADGTLVSNNSPAMAGEELVIYALGLGATNPAATAGQPVSQPTPTAETFTLDFNYHPNALASRPPILPSPIAAGGTAPLVPLFTGLTPGYPGLYQINFVVPPLQDGELPCAAGVAPPPGGLVNTNLTVSVGGAASFDGAGICVALVE